MNNGAVGVIMDWKPYTTMPENERVLVCYLNLWGHNHVTEAYLIGGGKFPITASGIIIKSPFMWAKMPDGPTFAQMFDMVQENLSSAPDSTYADIH
jgi:hypothetical protein